MRALVVAIVLAGCAAGPPSQELVDARAAYQRAAAGPAKELVPEKLLEAKQALEYAEKKHRDDKGSGFARMLAYVAHRRTLTVVAEAGIAAAHNSKVAAEHEYEEMLESSVQRSRDKLGKTQKTLEQAQQELREKQNTLKTKDAELAKEKAARTDAERRLAAAMKSLEEVAKVKEDARGTIITLSGAVLFRSSESALLPIAESQLQKVADALEAYEHGRRIVVAGHTDSIGPANANTMLSQARAEAVRDFLVEHGVPPDRIRAVGKGEDEPIADNKSPEGRANNRRVEIIVEPTQPQ